MAAPLVQEELLREGRVLRVALDSPKGNILTRSMVEALRKVLAAHAADPHLRLVILHGAGGNFCYGASVEEHRASEAAAMLHGFHGAIREVVGYPVPIAALVEGRCLGGGFELAMACHFLFASPTALLGCPEIKLGVFPPVLAALGSLRLGGALAERMILTGGTVGPDELQRVGALTAIVDGDALARVLEWYEANLAGLSAKALRLATRAARLGSGLLAAVGGTLDSLEAEYLQQVVPSHDGNEGIAAFLARQPSGLERRMTSASAATRLRATRHEEEQASILEVAARFIAVDGFHGMSMRELARATGRAPASLYNYFASKDELLFALQAGSFQQLIADAETRMAGAAGSSAKLHAFIANHLQYVVDHPEVMRVLVHEAASLPSARRGAVRELKEAYFELAESLVRDLVQAAARGRPGSSGLDSAADQGLVERTTYAIFGMLNWVYSWYRPERHGSPRVLAATLHGLAVGGLRSVCAGEEQS